MKYSNTLFDNIDHLLTAKEVGKILGLHHHTIYRWAREGRIPSKRLGRGVRFLPKELSRWLPNQE